MTAAIALLAALAAVAGPAAQPALAPPAVGVPNVSVARCLTWGHRIPVSGNGFAPGTRVVLSSPDGHYTGPTPGVRSVTVTAGARGGFAASLRAPRPAGSGPGYQPRVLFADGTGQASRAPGQSFAAFIVATRAACRAIDRSR